jgi:hypothetical protein
LAEFQNSTPPALPVSQNICPEHAVIWHELMPQGVCNDQAFTRRTLIQAARAKHLALVLPQFIIHWRQISAREFHASGQESARNATFQIHQANQLVNG